MPSDLDRADIRTAMAAVKFWKRVHEFSNVAVPPAADRLLERLEALMAANGQESVVSEQQWLTTDQIAERMQCSERTARRIAARVGKRIGRQWLAPPDALPTED